jgi:elongation of very long chain fatty acids protein 4
LHIYHHTSIAIAWWLGLKLYPGGDIYFGALINSWIHVMMYSYYTLSLLKISCPWKKYLTLAQLIQFLSVLVYSGVSMWHMPKDGTWLQYVGHCVQDFEMTSLFVLFMHFYRKAYSSKNSKKTTSSFESEASEATTEQDSISSASSDDR